MVSYPGVKHGKKEDMPKLNLSRRIRNMGMQWLILCAVVIIGTVLSRGVFITPTNLINILRQSADVGVLAVGQTLAIMIAGIDLSVGSLLALSSVAAATLMRDGYGIVTSMLIAVTMCLLFGGITGLSTGFARIPPFISTLAMMGIARGAAYTYAQGQPVYNLPKEFLAVGRGSIGPIPVQVVVWLVIVLAVLILLERSRWGRYILMVGGNEEASRLAGVNVGRVKLLVFAISGLTAGVAGIIVTSRLNMGAPFLGMFMELDSITAVVLGGTSLNGGEGSILGTVAGVILLGMMNNLMNILNVNPFFQQAVKGAIMLAAVYLNITRRRTVVQ